MSAYFQQLITYLGDNGTIVRPRRGPIQIRMFRGLELAPPVRIAFGEAELDDALNRIGRDARGLYPDDPVMLAGFKLFLVHVDETLATRPPERIDLVFDGHALTVK
jgi:hypothetical protein